ncbi:MAG: YIP1 family protein [Staphylococcus sp.]|jgi:tetratricopeptide (TPR) repeat protein|nr:YIP1 family protein [Staphylococcus sp.]
MRKTTNLMGKIIIVLLLTLMVFSPNLLTAKAASYSYDFWKNVIPSAEGLAYSDTYYSDSIRNLDGSELTNKITYDNLTDMATYQDKIYVLDSKKNTKVEVLKSQVVNGFAYPAMEGNGISSVYILNQDFQLVEELNEFRITDEVKKKLQDYYNFYYESYQIVNENLVAREFINFYQNDSEKYSLTLSAGSKEIVVTEFVYAPYTYISKDEPGYYTYDNTLLELSINGEKIDKSLWRWEAVEIYKKDENNEDVFSHIEYKIVLDDSLVSNQNVIVEAEILVPSTIGKAPYLPYSKDPSKLAIRLNNASGITVTKDGMYIADSGNARIIRVNKQGDEWVVDGVYLTPDDNIFYQISSNISIVDVTGVTLFNPQKVAVDQTGRLYCIAQNVYEGIMEFHTSGSFNRFLGKNEVVANPLKKFWTKIFSETQIASLNLDLPPEFTNIAMDENGFLYATSHPDADATTNANMVKMINTSGKDIMKRNGYVTPDGDAVYLTTSTEEGVIIGMSNLVGITVSKNGNFTIVDELRGRLFTYDNEGNLLYITGEQPGGNSSSGSTTLSSSIIDPVAIRYFYRDSGEVDEDGNPIQEEVLLVLDTVSKSIILFQTTEFGEAVNKATELYQNGIVQDEYLLDENGEIVLDSEGNPIIKQYGAETYWQQVVKMNTNYELAYLGIGKALLRRGEYKEAMDYFELAHSATYYSKAYSEYRDAILSKNFSWIMTAVILVVVLWIVLSYRKYLKKKNLALAAATAMNEEKAAILSGRITALHRENQDEEKMNDSEDDDLNEETQDVKKFSWLKIWNSIKYFFKETVGYPLYILTHPIQGFTDFKIEKKGKMWVSIVILLMYVLMEILAYQYEGIITNTNNPQKFNSIQILIYGVLPPIILAVTNWSVTTLLDGKGKMKEIFMMICYSLFPVTVFGFLNIILSNVMTLDEAQFITLINIIGWVLTGIMAFMGLVVIHEYGVGKTIWSIILTIVATLIIAFIALLVFDLVQQMYGFVYSLYKEITTRYF